MVSPVFHSSHFVQKRREDIFQVSRRLHLRGHELYVITNKTFGAPEYEEVDGIKIFRVPAYLIPSIRYPITSISALLKILKYIINRFNIEIIHFWNVEHLISLASISNITKNIPKVISIEGLPGINWFYGISIVDFCGFLYTMSVGKFVLSSVSSVIVYGKSIIKYLSALGINENKIRIIAYGVDTKKFHPIANIDTVRIKYGFKSHELIILYVGRLEPVKGIDYLLKAIFRVFNKFDNVKLLIVGDGSLRYKVQKASQKSGGKIIFMGYRKDIPEIINIADVVVLPSLSEGLPLTVLEAQACGKPVIATRVGCVPDAVINNKTGILVEPKSIDSLSSALLRILEDDLLRKKLSINALKYVLRKYNWDNIILKYENLYKELIGSNR